MSILTLKTFLISPFPYYFFCSNNGKCVLYISVLQGAPENASFSISYDRILPTIEEWASEGKREKIDEKYYLPLVLTALYGRLAIETL